MAFYNNKINNPESDVDVSRFNTGAFINQRIHNSCLQCRNHWVNGRFRELNTELDAMWMEFCADATKDQEARMVVIDKQIADAYIKAATSKDKTEIRVALYLFKSTIKTKWQFLKKVEKSQGLGKSYRDEFEDDFD